MKKIFTLSLAALMLIGEALPVLTVAAVTTAVLAPADSQALPVDRAVGRAGAQNSRQAGRQGAQASRQTGRQVSQARRRGCYALPRGAAPFRYGGYSYYRVGPRFYYPYIYMGRTVYIDIDIVAGNPAPPPPVGSITIDIY